MRNLEELANATPKDYLSYAPKNPELLGIQLLAKAQKLFTGASFSNEDANISETVFTVLYVGSGSGLVVQSMISRGDREWVRDL